MNFKIALCVLAVLNHSALMVSSKSVRILALILALVFGAVVVFIFFSLVRVNRWWHVEAWIIDHGLRRAAGHLIALLETSPDVLE